MLELASSHYLNLQPFTMDFPRANIHELLSPDLLHQIIKGTFKDHLVTWVVDWMETQPNSKDIITEMDRRCVKFYLIYFYFILCISFRISAAPVFSGLRRFPEGRGFKQWTGNDSKALMKVFLPSIAGLVPPGMVRAVSAFMEFCSLVRRSQIDETVLLKIDAAVETFHRERLIFVEEGIREDFNLPRQHSLVHYRSNIQMFGAPNGLCSSIAESKHIKAVKEPWRRSNRNNPLGQMLLTNQRLDKLAALRVELDSNGMLISADGNPQPQYTRPPLPKPNPGEPQNLDILDMPEDVDEEAEEGFTSEGDVRLPRRPGVFHKYSEYIIINFLQAVGYPKTLALLSQHLSVPHLDSYIRRFLFDQLNPDSDIFGMEVDINECPQILPTLRLNVFHSAAAIYHAPSDLSGIGGMHREYIRAAPTWRGHFPRHDCVFVEREPNEEGFRALGVAQVHFFFSFEFNNILYPCALVRWFETYGNSPCPDTGMWMVKPDTEMGQRICSVIHIDSILRAAHLIGVYGKKTLPEGFKHYHSLTAFKLYYVNKYADHHAHEIAF